MSDWFTLGWEDRQVVILDQRELPERETYLRLDTVEGVAQAIETLAVRGAPAIGCAAALGVALAAHTAFAVTASELALAIEPDFERLARTRPTAVNLFWALSAMRAELETALREPGIGTDNLRDRLLERAQRIVQEDAAICRQIGSVGAGLVSRGARILTHCNAGALATAGYGTALGVVRSAFKADPSVTVLAGETRPLLQGSRLTAWELSRDGIPVSVLTDSMPASLMQKGEIDLVIVGADRIARNGDVANKIGTYGLAVLAREHGIPFYVAAPLSTVDLDTATGDDIPIEERDGSEVSSIGNREMVPPGVPVRSPAFDVTPARLVDAIVTEAGLAKPPGEATLAKLFEKKH